MLTRIIVYQSAYMEVCAHLYRGICRGHLYTHTSMHVHTYTTHSYTGVRQIPDDARVTMDVGLICDSVTPLMLAAAHGQATVCVRRRVLAMPSLLCLCVPVWRGMHVTQICSVHVKWALYSMMHVWRVDCDRDLHNVDMTCLCIMCNRIALSTLSFLPSYAVVLTCPFI